MRLRKNLRIWVTLLLCIALLCGGGIMMKTHVKTLREEAPEHSVQQTETVPVTEAVTEESSSLLMRPDPASDTVDDTIFENTAIIGNSCILGLKTYGLIKTADFYARVGLTVQNAAAYVDTQTNQGLIEALGAKAYDRVLLMFGENELGWPYPDNFIRLYKELVRAIQAVLPQATFYIVAVTPIGKAMSETSTNGVTMANATVFNAKLEQMAQDLGAGFLDATDLLLDSSTGYLKSEASADGVHLNLAYCKIWASDMIDQIGRNEALW